MANNKDDNITRAMKTNHRSSGDGAGMDRSVYVDDGSEDKDGRGATGAAKTAKGWAIAALLVVVIVLVLAARSLGWLDGIS